MSDSKPFKQPGNIINLVGVIVGVVLVLLTSREMATVVGVVVIFACASLIVWNLPIIENYINRRVFCIAVLAFGCFMFARYAWPDNQLPSSTEVKLGELEKVVKGLGEKYRREELLKKYPLGYVVFDLGYQNSVIPYDSRLASEYRLDWRVVGFTKVTQDEYELRLPDISTKDGKAASSNVIVGGKKRVGDGPGTVLGNVIMWTEILAISNRGIVFLIGFRPLAAR